MQCERSDSEETVKLDKTYEFAYRADVIQHESQPVARMFRVRPNNLSITEDQSTGDMSSNLNFLQSVDLSDSDIAQLKECLRESKHQNSLLIYANLKLKRENERLAAKLKHEQQLNYQLQDQLISGEVHTPKDKHVCGGSQTASEIESLRPIPDLTQPHRLILDSLPKTKPLIS